MYDASKTKQLPEITDYCALEQYLEDTKKMQDTAVFSGVSMFKIEKNIHRSLVTLTKK